MSADPEWLVRNRASWDERVPFHLASDMYDVPSYRAGRETLEPFELEQVGDIRGKTLLHLQCHFGLDTLSWARHGARVTGLDFSESAVDAASRLAVELGFEADFVCSDVYDAPAALAGRQFDVVYTGRGAFNWLPDIASWARNAFVLAKPGGIVYIQEFHPFAWIFDDDEPKAAYPYFYRPEAPLVWDEPGTYADRSAPMENTVTHEWNHGLGEVVTALIRAGFVIELLEEYDYTRYEAFTFLQETEPGYFTTPPEMPNMPLMYALKARRPG